MQKTFLFLAAFLVIAPLSAVAEDIDDHIGDYFPLDQDIIWVYDDENVDTIVGISTIGLPEKRTVNLFMFGPYNHEKRMFYRLGEKIFEWRDSHSRLWYDFGADEGATWKLEWAPVSAEKMEPGMRETIGSVDSKNMPLNDINTGATITLLEKGLTVRTPMGEFNDVIHFRTVREGVADAAYVDEYFAPGVGCVMREWDTIAGPRQQRLAKYDWQKPQADYRIDFKLDKEIYLEGESIEIVIHVINWSEQELTLEFPTSHQVDYFIDDSYQWSEGRGFTEAETTVTILPGEMHNWKFTHTPEDYAVPPGEHTIAVKLVGTGQKAFRRFIVAAERPPLPEGLELSVATSQETYSPGEFIDFVLTAANTTESDIVIKVLDNYPVKYTIDQYIQELEILVSRLTAYADLTIPAGESVEFRGRHSAHHMTIKPGDPILYAGLHSYIGMAKTQFTVTNELSYGELAGTVRTPLINDGELDILQTTPIIGARVLLTPVIPRNRDMELDFMPMSKMTGWTDVTDDTGQFFLKEVPVGSYFILHVESEGFYPYNETIRFLAEKNMLDIVLKPVNETPAKPLIFQRHKVGDLVVGFGTESSVYQPDSPFKAFFSITNIGKSAVSFTFDNKNFVEWLILDEREAVVWQSTDYILREAEKSTAEYDMTLDPGQSREFDIKETFIDKVPLEGGKYTIRGVLKFAASSIEGLESKEVSGAVKVMVVSKDQHMNDSQRINAQSKSRELVVDLKEKANTVIDMVMRDENVEGEMLVTELLNNPHKPKQLHRFIKMVEIDADSLIRANLEKAYIRIYYNPEDFGPDFNPEKLSIAHWRDNPDWDAESVDISDDSAEADWEELECRVDTLNNFVEASTENFSSFALFEYDPSSTSVDEGPAVPEQFELSQNIPNPFNPSTLIQFTIPQSGVVRISVYNIMGQEVAQLHNGMLFAGTHRVTFDGRSQASGVYFYRIYGNGFSATKKMLLMK